MVMKKFSIILLIIAFIGILAGGIMLIVTNGKTNYTMIVYVKDGISENDSDNLKKFIADISGVQGITYIDKEQAFEQAISKFRLENGDETAERIEKSYTKNNHPFKASYEIVYSKKNSRDKIVDALKNSKYKDYINEIK